MKLGSMADLTADITPEQRERIDAIKTDLVDAERGYELATLRKSQGFTQAQVAAGMGVTQGRISGGEVVGAAVGQSGARGRRKSRGHRGGVGHHRGALPTGVTDVHAAGYR